MSKLEIKVMHYQLDKDFPKEILDRERESFGNDYEPEGEYLVVYYNKELIRWYDSRMEPEDATFSRDLGWIEILVREAYTLGKLDGNTETYDILCTDKHECPYCHSKNYIQHPIKKDEYPMMICKDCNKEFWSD